MSVLDDIVAGVRIDLDRRRQSASVADLRAALADVDPPRDPMPAFRDPGSSVIAEVKRRSPSKGDLADIPDPADLARRYAAGGAAAIRVLTVEPYQVLEARAAGADLVLLIVAALDDDSLRRLHDEARELGLTVLVEVHDEAETERAVALGAELVGINARNLRTLDVDPGAFARLAPLVQDDRVLVAESGITGPDDVVTYVGLGARVVLVGEALVRDGDPAGAVRTMTGVTA